MLEIISTYSRSDAIEDGVLVDVSEVAREAGYRFPVALSADVWARYVELEPRDASRMQDANMMQDESGRLWDILWMSRFGKDRPDDPTTRIFKLYVAMPDRGDWQENETVPERSSDLTRETHRFVTLKAVCGPGDDAEPVITIMLPRED